MKNNLYSLAFNLKYQIEELWDERLQLYDDYVMNGTKIDTIPIIMKIKSLQGKLETIVLENENLFSNREARYLLDDDI